LENILFVCFWQKLLLPFNLSLSNFSLNFAFTCNWFSIGKNLHVKNHLKLIYLPFKNILNVLLLLTPGLFWFWSNTARVVTKFGPNFKVFSIRYFDSVSNGMPMGVSSLVLQIPKSNIKWETFKNILQEEIYLNFKKGNFSMKSNGF